MNALARLKRDRLALAALVVVATYALVALLVALGLVASDPGARVGAKLLPPGAAHWLGTDRQGRDVFVRVLYGAKIALSVGLVTSLLAVLLGGMLGALAGWFGGRVDSVITWLYSTVESVPAILLLMGLCYVAGRGLAGVYLAFIATFWVAPCRTIRGEVLRLSRADFVVAARALGLHPGRVLLHHVAPNTFPVALVHFTLAFVSAIKSEVILSFLGLGVRGEPSWGIMIDQARSELVSGFYWQFAAATGALFVVVLALSVFADALQDALDPRTR